MPICFSWPVLPSTVNPSDFLLTLNTGKTVQPEVASINPNFLYNKRSCVVTVVGLADLGKYNEPLNDAYIADRDNYLDIILKGDVDAMRLITAVIIPTSGGYSPLYNPGGPGNNPTPGVTYTSPGPYTYQPVTIAIDDPLTVNYP